MCGSNDSTQVIKGNMILRPSRGLRHRVGKPPRVATVLNLQQCDQLGGQDDAKRCLHFVNGLASERRMLVIVSRPRILSQHHLANSWRVNRSAADQLANPQMIGPTLPE